MAITTTKGTVRNLKIRQDGVVDTAFFELMDSQTNLPEMFLLWDAEVGQPTPFSVWIARSLVVSLLRDALVNKLKVTVQHDDAGSVVQFVNLTVVDGQPTW
jgi:hypothetical protein